VRPAFPVPAVFPVRLAVRQAWADRWLLLALTLLIAGSAAGAVAVPRLLVSTMDSGARDAVRSAGAALVAEQPVLGSVNAGSAQENAVTLAGAVDDSPALRTVAGPPSAVVTSVPLPLSGGRSLRLVEVWAADSDVRWVRGGAPTGLGVGLTEPVAAALGARVGTSLRAGTLTLRVTGVFQPASPGAAIWRHSPGLLAPTGPDAAALITGAQLPRLVAALSGSGGPPFTAAYQLAAEPRLHAADVPAIRAAIDTLAARPDLVYPDSGTDAGTPSVRSPLAGPLADFAVRQRAVLALASLVLTALVGVGALVVVLAAHLLVTRRAGDLALQHARGASRTGIAARALAEATVLTAVGVAVGGGIAVLVGRPGSLLPLGALVLVAVLAPPVLVSRAIRARPRARNRRRLVVEGVLVVLAVGGTVAVRRRGLLDSPGGVDLLLAATPLLLAGAVTAAVLRGFPWPLRGLHRLAGRTRGAIGPVGVGRAVTSWAAGPLPLLVLTLAGTLAVTGGLLRSAVLHGQQYAAWERVGADARVTAPARTAAFDALAGAPGVRHAAVGEVRQQIPYLAGDRYGVVQLLLVDSTAYDAVLRDTALPYGGELSRLTIHSGRTLPVLASPELAARIGQRPARLTVDGRPYPVTLLGPLSVRPAGWLPGDTLIADRAVAALILPAQEGSVVAWLTGPGAAAAAATTGGTVVTRAGWLAETSGSPMVAGTLRLLTAAGLAVAGYAGIALLLVVLATAPARNRALAYLRTLGLPAGRGRAVAVLELGPVVAAAGLAGAAGGVLVPVLLRPGLGLTVLTGGVTDQPLAPRPGLGLALAAALLGALAALLALALTVDALAHRRQRLDAVLRLGAER
jgi:putative ABC transport system permease protein